MGQRGPRRLVWSPLAGRSRPQRGPSRDQGAFVLHPPHILPSRKCWALAGWRGARRTCRTGWAETWGRGIRTGGDSGPRSAQAALGQGSCVPEEGTLPGGCVGRRVRRARPGPSSVGVSRGTEVRETQHRAGVGAPHPKLRPRRAGSPGRGEGLARAGTAAGDPRGDSAPRGLRLAVGEGQALGAVTQGDGSLPDLRLRDRDPQTAAGRGAGLQPALPRGSLPSPLRPPTARPSPRLSLPLGFSACRNRRPWSWQREGRGVSSSDSAPSPPRPSPRSSLRL